MIQSELIETPRCKCLCCETFMFVEFQSFEICNVCWWQDDLGASSSCFPRGLDLSNCE